MILAIDQGTSGTTCLVVDGELEIRGRGYVAIARAVSAARLGRAGPGGDLVERARRRGGRARIGRAPGGADLAAIGITNQRETTILWERALGPAVAGRDRLAGPPHRRALPRAAGGADPGADRSRPRSVLLGDEARVAAGADRAACGGARVRHRRQLARVEAHRRPPSRHRRDERGADDAVRHRPARVGRRAARSLRRGSVAAAGGGGDVRRPRRRGAVRRGAADREPRRRPAGRAVRAGVLRAARGEGDVRDRELRARQRRRRPRRCAGRAPEDRRGGRARVTTSSTRSRARC